MIFRFFAGVVVVGFQGALLATGPWFAFFFFSAAFCALFFLRREQRGGGRIQAGPVETEGDHLHR